MLPDDVRSVYRNVASLKRIVHDVGSKLYFDHWTDKRKTFTYKSMQFVIRHKFRHKFSICFLKLKRLSIVIASNSTWFDSLTLTFPIAVQYLGRRDFPRIINGSSLGFALRKFKFNHLKRFFISRPTILPKIFGSN